MTNNEDTHRQPETMTPLNMHTDLTVASSPVTSLTGTAEGIGQVTIVLPREVALALSKALSDPTAHVEAAKSTYTFGSHANVEATNTHVILTGVASTPNGTARLQVTIEGHAFEQLHQQRSQLQPR